MDKNTITGLVLMCAVIFGFMYCNRPSQEEIERQKEAAKQEQLAREQQQAESNVTVLDSLTTDDVNNLMLCFKSGEEATTTLNDNDVKLTLNGNTIEGTVKAGDTIVNYADVVNCKIADVAVHNKAVEALRAAANTKIDNGVFASKMTGSNTITTLENDSLKLEISSKGGMISRATLKGYTAFNAPRVEVFTPGENEYSFIMNTDRNRYSTQDYYFTPKQVNDSTVEMSLELSNGAVFGMRYILARGGNYMVRMEVFQKNMDKVIAPNITNLDFYWHQKMMRHEAGKMFEERNSTFYYKYLNDDDVEYLTETSRQEEKENNRLKWISTKNQFFSAILIADKDFNGAKMTSVPFEKGTADYEKYLKDLTVYSSFDYKSTMPSPASFTFYLGPNRYRTLRNYEDMLAAYKLNNEANSDLKLTKVIPLGWKLFRWINTGIIIPLFNWLGSFIANYGIVILILTLIIKLVLWPLVNKSYSSQAKMKILAPDIKEINEKYPGQENAIKRQQKTMELYKLAGANPMGGCLPMLLQMPILIAVFTFFPSCIELRGQSFLWANDLSAPDAIVSWTGQIPFITNYFGNHISLFCLLMTSTNLIYTYLTMQSQSSSTMPGMKWMMYLMPIFFLVFFNNYASGLSYYYFISLLITIVQTYISRARIKESNVRAVMAENAKKPKKKRGGWAARLEEAQKRQQEIIRQQQAKQNRNGKGRR